MENEKKFREFINNKSEKIINKYSELNNEQRSKGFSEYGKYLEDCKFRDYDWNVEALRECIDANAYLCMENARLRETSKLLQYISSWYGLHFYNHDGEPVTTDEFDEQFYQLMQNIKRNKELETRLKNYNKKIIGE